MYDPEKVFHELERAADAWVNKQLLSDQLLRTGEILLAKMMLEARNIGVAASLCKEAARTADEWKVHVHAEVIAVNESLRARLRYQNCRALSDARRTFESSMRAITR